MSVDGIHCRVWEPRITPSSGWYSQKYNKAGLSYELGISIYYNKLVWINGPFPAGRNDKQIFSASDGLKSKIPVGKKIVADEGYRGDPDLVATRNSFDIGPLKRFKARVKARHESFNGRLKSFNILSQAFRSTGHSRMNKHKAAFEACCIIVQYEIENGHPLFEV